MLGTSEGDFSPAAMRPGGAEQRLLPISLIREGTLSELFMRHLDGLFTVLPGQRLPRLDYREFLCSTGSHVYTQLASQ